MQIHNKTVIITGAASGLGASTATHLSYLHANVILLDKNKMADNIIECDVTDENAVQKILNTQDEIHAVVNCAGIVHVARLIGKTGAMPLADFHRVIHVNLLGTFNLMRLAAEKMSLQNPVDDSGERGVIINATSIAAFEGQIGQVAYSASKGAIASMTLPAARELARFGIRVMTIAPGVMQTPMVASLPPETQQALAKDIPFPKQLGDPQRFAELVAHIIQNNYLNGSTIRLDAALRLQ